MFLQEFIFLGQGCCWWSFVLVHVGVLGVSIQEAWMSRVWSFKFKFASRAGREKEEFRGSICFRILTFDLIWFEFVWCLIVVCVSCLSFYCHWASVYVRVFLGMERRQRARFLTPTMSSFFRPRFSYFISVLLCCILEVGEDRFPLGRVCPVLIEEWINVGKLYWCLLATRSQRKCIFP